MTMRMNREAFQKLIDEDRTWLAKQERTLERDHIDMILATVVEGEYGPTTRKIMFHCEKCDWETEAGLFSLESYSCPKCGGNLGHGPKPVLCLGCGTVIPSALAKVLGVTYCPPCCQKFATAVAKVHGT